MPATVTPVREAAPAQTRLSGAATLAPEHAPSQPYRGPQARSSAPARRPTRPATDDEILGLATPEKTNAPDAQLAFEFEPGVSAGDSSDTSEAPAATPVATDTSAEPENLRAVFDANPDLRRAWHDAQSYREMFATPEEARAATALLADLDRMDALFFSRRPADHAELARAIAHLDPAAFVSLVHSMNALAMQARSRGGSAAADNPVAQVFRPEAPTDSAGKDPASKEASYIDGRADGAPLEDATSSRADRTSVTAAQAEFFHAANAAAVQGVLDAIESQVERLLPEGVSKSARNRVVGEIYRELDATLRSNRQLAQQMREAFYSGALDADHLRAIVSLVTGRARQALPGVAKRVLNEWTSTIVAANQDRRARQRAAERRVDIAGSSGAGNDARRSMTPRDIDYARLSDADILNL